MKKMAGILICIALAFSFAGCSWQIPQKVSVKTDANYNFALGNFEKDFSENLNVSKMIGDLKLPNNGKVYDYWPNKKGDTQSFLMYMPLQEIPIDIDQYFNKGSIADSIQNISFSKEIEVPEVDFEYAFDIDLDKVNDAVCQNFQLAGPIENYSTAAFGAILSDFADSVSFEKGHLIINAYTVSNYQDLLSATSVASLPRTLDTNYYGSVSITSNDKTISGNFIEGVADINLSDYNGFELKSNNINISFSNKPSIINPLDGKSYPTHLFIAKIDTSDKTYRPYQIEKVTNLKNVSVNDPPTIHEEVDALTSLKSAGLEGCTIGTGQILLDFALPTEWSGVEVTYSMDLTGGIELSTGQLSTASNYPVSLSLKDKSISAQKINVDASFNLILANATIDFRKKPKIGIESNITKISTVTVKLSDTSLSFSYPQKPEDKLPSTVLDVVKSIALNQCGITGTYTNTLPGENNKVSLTVFSDFFNIHDSENVSNGYKFDLESNSENKAISILSEATAEPRQVKLGTDSSAGEKDSFDFNVDVTLPGGVANKITVQDVEPGKTYKFAINLTPVIDWDSVIIDLDSLPSTAKPIADKISTGFNPSSIFSSIEDMLGKQFANSIKLPDSKLHLYLTKPEGVRTLDNLSFNNSSISMFYGTKAEGDSTITRVGSIDKDIEILKKGESIKFVPAPTLTIEKDSDGNEIVTAKVSTNSSMDVDISKLLEPTVESKTEGAQLCVDYNISLSGVSNGVDELGNPIEGIKITKSDLETSNSGSIGVYAIIELPLSFDVAANSTINLKNLINKKNHSENSEEPEEEEKDIFGRKEATDPTEFEKYLKVIETAVINYRLDSFPIKTTDDIEFVIAMGNETDEIKKTLRFDTDDTEPIVITNDDVMDLIKIYPLTLKTADVVFPNATSISIPRTKKLDINLQIGITTNDEPIELFGGNK